MKKLLLLFALLNTGCTLFYPPNGPKHYKPEQFPPTQERLEELMKLTKPPVPYNAKFEVIVYPRVILDGGSVRVRCLVPPKHQDSRTMRFGMEQKEMSEVTADHYEHVRLYQKMECGTWTASCTLSTGERREQQLTVRGACNEVDDRDK